MNDPNYLTGGAEGWEAAALLAESGVPSEALAVMARRNAAELRRQAASAPASVDPAKVARAALDAAIRAADDAVVESRIDSTEDDGLGSIGNAVSEIRALLTDKAITAIIEAARGK